MNEPNDLMLRTPGSTWRSPATTEYGSEDQMQDLLAAEPSLLPGVSEGAATVREFSVPAVGFVDLVVVDQTATITVVECKLAKNPEMRRTVVGQVLAYAAGLWRLSYEDFDAGWRARNNGTSLVEHVFGNDATIDTEEPFRKAITSALDAGSFTLVFAVDAITEELRNTVQYLNAHTSANTTCLALELAYARDGDVEIVRPRTFGVEAQRAKAASQSHRWTEADVLEAVGLVAPTLLGGVTAMIDHYRATAVQFYLGDGQSPSITAWFAYAGAHIQPFSVYTGTTIASNGIAANFDWMKAVPEPVKLNFIERISQIPGVAERIGHVVDAGFARRPTLPFGLFETSGAIEIFVAATDELLASDTTI